MKVTTIDELRMIYAAPKPLVIRKQLDRLDPHCKRFISLSPFLVLATSGAHGGLDASPRGGAPGFVKCPDDGHLLVPDAPGNNRLDSLENILATGCVGLIFFVPGVDETLRINGSATLSTAQADLTACTDERRTPKVVIRVAVEEAYLHCAKALMRSRLWNSEAQLDRASLPTIGQMIRDQTGAEIPDETQEQIVLRYRADL